MDIIPRPRYLNRIRPYFGTKIIKAVVGQRRVGKSCVLLQIAELLRAEHPDWMILHIDLERLEWRHLQTGDDLVREVSKAASSKIETGAHTAQAKIVLLLDEVQELKGYETAVRGFAADERFDVYISGSNAHLLSGDIATLFAGRVVRIEVHSLTYDEFLIFNKLKDNDASLERFLRYGGLPFIANLPNDDLVLSEYLAAVLDSVVLKDVVQRHGIRSPALLERILEFTADNVGSPTSARNISNYLKNIRVDASPQSVLDYLGYLTRSFALIRCPTMDITGKKILEGNSKYYFEDLGLRAVVRGNRDADIGKIVENAVFGRLAADGWTVSSGRVGDREIDFVAERGEDCRFIQAAYLIPDSSTRDREFGALVSLRGGWPRYVISMDPLVQDWQGIHHLKLRDFLRDGFENVR
jgi:predicted AAA+ superfamily ATPase